MALGGDTTVTIDELFFILEMAHFQSGDILQKKIYRNTFKILEKNASDTTLSKRTQLRSSTRTRLQLSRSSKWI
jgi:gamma-glutamyl phosphate reductase